MLDVGILGTLEVRRDGRRMDVPGARQRALLVTLAMHVPAVVAADHLIEVLWGPQPPKDPSNQLQWQVASLRRILGGDAIGTRAPGYVLHTTRERIDVRRFEHLLDDAHALAATDVRRAQRTLRLALRLWRGPPLVDLPDDPRFAAEARRLHDLRLVALEDLLALGLAAGDAPLAAAEADALVREHPYRERFHALRMRALYASGRQAEALAAFQEARAALDAELGIEPGPELRELERAILRQDPALAADPPRTRPRPVPAPDGPGRRDGLLPSIVVVAADAAELDLPLAIARSLCGATHPREIVLARLLEPDRSGDLPAATRDLSERRAELAAAGLAARVAAFTSDRWSDDVVHLAEDAHVDLVLLALPWPVGSAHRLPVPVAEVLAAAPCDVALVVARHPGRSDGAVLVAFAGAEHDWAALELAAWFAAAEERTLRLAGAAGDSGSGRRDASQLLAVASLAVQELVGVVAEPVIVAPTAQAVLAAAAEVDLLVLPLADTWQADGLGHFRAAVIRAATTDLLLVRSGRRPGGLTPPDGLTPYSWSRPPPPPR